MARLTVFFGLMLILSSGTICSSALNAFSLEDKLQELEVRLEAKIEAKNAQLEAKVTQLEAQLEQNNELRQDLALKVIQLEAKNVQLEVKIEKLEAKVEQQDSLLTSLLREKNERTAAAAAATNSVRPIGHNQSPVAINGLPSSCADLKLIGHTLSGIYSVMGSAKMESVFCDFTKLPDDAGFEKWIGFADVKSAPVHFYVTRNSYFDTKDTPIPFDLARVNEGNAMDLASGIFTAPRPGIYFFSFTAVAHLIDSSEDEYHRYNADFNVYLFLNGNEIGDSSVVESNGRNGPVNQYSPLTLQSTLNLKKDDQLWVTIYYYNTSSYLVESIYHSTHFTGFMLEEEIVSSL